MHSKLLTNHNRYNVYFKGCLHNADGVYFGRKTFIRLYIVSCVCFGIILLEIVFGLLNLFKG